jgi:opacity protein-like surface antigen
MRESNNYTKNRNRMKLSKIALTLIVTAAVATPAMRASATDAGKGYMTLDGGVNIMQDVTAEFVGYGSGKVEMDTGFRVGLIGGYNLNDWVGLEIESGFMYNGVKNTDSTWLGTVPILGNIVLRYDHDNKVIPYIAAGAGGAFTMLEDSNNGETDFVFAWQLKAGVAFKLSDNVSLDLAYKFFSTAEQEYSSGGDTLKFKDIYAHYVGLGLTWRF